MKLQKEMAGRNEIEGKLGKAKMVAAYMELKQE